MLTPEYYKELPNEILEIFEELEDEIIRDIARRLKKTGELTETAKWQIQKLIDRGYDYREIKKEIRRVSDLSNKELTKMIDRSAIEAYKNDMLKYAIGKKFLPEYRDNQNILKIVEAIKRTASFDNITGTLGVPSDGEVVLLEDFYRKSMGKAVLKIHSGAFTLDDVMREALRELGDRGVRVIDYESGRSINLESAVRRNIVTTIGKLSNEIALMNAFDMGQDIMELSAHAGARDDHKTWQGELVSLSGAKGYLSLDDIGYGLIDGFQGVNCRHDWFPFFPGISKRNYTDEELRNIDPAPIEFEGKTYTLYDATQKQRQIENSIRKSRRRLVGFKEAGLDDDFLVESVRLKRKEQRYIEVSKALNVPVRRNRLTSYGWDRSISQKAVWARKKEYKARISGDKWKNADFKNEKSLNYHVEKHLSEFNFTTKDEYINTARELLKKELSENIQGFVSTNFFVFKYDVKENVFVVGREDGYISTCFKPKMGIEYWIGEVEKYEKLD